MQGERLIGLGEAAKILTAHVNSVRRWICQGAIAPSGQKVKLEAVRVGSRWKTSSEAIQRFVAALTPSTDPPPHAPSQAKRDSRAEYFGRKLREMGCGTAA
jgi:hypothetical protein